MAKTYARKEKQRCSVCNSSFTIRLYPDGRYIGGHYFFTTTLSEGKGRYEKVGRVIKHDIVRWTGKKKRAEYWECNGCFDKGSHESWLEEMIEELYGKKCKDYEPGCACCQAWELYDNIVEEGKEQAKKTKKNKRAKK